MVQKQDLSLEFIHELYGLLVDKTHGSCSDTESCLSQDRIITPCLYRVLLHVLFSFGSPVPLCTLRLMCNHLFYHTLTSFDTTERYKSLRFN